MFAELWVLFSKGHKIENLVVIGLVWFPFVTREQNTDAKEKPVVLSLSLRFYLSKAQRNNIVRAKCKLINFGRHNTRFFGRLSVIME